MANHVTLVDDCSGLLYLVALLLERELGVACHGRPSFENVRENADDVLESQVMIVDINLGPGKPDGVAVYEWLRSQSYQGRVFFMTGHASDSPQVKQAARTGVRILEKPMTASEFITVLREAMHQVGRST